MRMRIYKSRHDNLVAEIDIALLYIDHGTITLEHAGNTARSGVDSDGDIFLKLFCFGVENSPGVDGGSFDLHFGLYTVDDGSGV